LTIIGFQVHLMGYTPNRKETSRHRGKTHG